VVDEGVGEPNRPGSRESHGAMRVCEEPLRHPTPQGRALPSPTTVTFTEKVSVFVRLGVLVFFLNEAEKSTGFEGIKATRVLYNRSAEFGHSRN
jgi:hypothetical protein